VKQKKVPKLLSRALWQLVLLKHKTVTSILSRQGRNNSSKENFSGCISEGTFYFIKHAHYGDMPEK
jgi:hypothetical protein